MVVVTSLGSSAEPIGAGSTYFSVVISVGIKAQVSGNQTKGCLDYRDCELENFQRTLLGIYYPS